ncbi:MAG: hypothetical protein GY759_00905 [Chloroflexi bacterium]|nr:hypothetical protein [Chloroflexota bacterium]
MSDPCSHRKPANPNIGKPKNLVYDASTFAMKVHPSLQVYRSTGLPVYRPTGLPVYRPTGLPTYRSTGLPVYRPTGTWSTNTPTIPMLDLLIMGRRIR